MLIQINRAFKIYDNNNINNDNNKYENTFIICNTYIHDYIKNGTCK